MDSPHEGFEFNQPQSEDVTSVFTSTLFKTSVAECMSTWIYYLQMLNGLCTAGLKLSQNLGTLSQTFGHGNGTAGQCIASWDELTKATLIATHTVKTHISAAMQDISFREIRSESEFQQQIENNQQIVSENLLTFINLQYQFSIAACECLGSMATCPCCQTASGGVHDPDCSMATLQQCFARLYTQEARSQTSSPHGGPSHIGHDVPRVHSPGTDVRVPSPYEPVRGPSPVHGFLDTIRSAGHIETIRGPFPNPGQLHTMKAPFPGRRGSRSPLNFPLFPLSGQRRWSEAAAAEVTGESSDGTMRRWSMPWDSGKTDQNVWSARMTKLSVPTSTSSQDRSRSTTPETATFIPAISGSEGLADAIQLLSSRPSRVAPQPHQPHPTEERVLRKMYHVHGHRGLGNIQDQSQTEHYDVGTQNYPHTSRKSSSSTDSSSCLSIHSRSTNSSDKGSENGAGESMRSHTHLYSIWSGNDYLPFIRVPESKEPQDDSDTDETSTNSSTLSLFPKPS